MGMGRIYDLTSRLGGGYMVGCKSAKDRTAMWIARIHAGMATKKEKVTSLVKKLQLGISYSVAEINKGAPGYALIKDYAVLPYGMTPPLEGTSGGET